MADQTLGQLPSSKRVPDLLLRTLSIQVKWSMWLIKWTRRGTKTLIITVTIANVALNTISNNLFLQYNCLKKNEL